VCRCMCVRYVSGSGVYVCLCTGCVRVRAGVGRMCVCALGVCGVSGSGVYVCLCTDCVHYMRAVCHHRCVRMCMCVCVRACVCAYMNIHDEYLDSSDMSCKRELPANKGCATHL